MTATSAAKGENSANKLRRFFRGISAVVSLPRIRVDSTPEALARPSRVDRHSVCAGECIPCQAALTVPRRNNPLHLSKSRRADFAGSRLQYEIVVSVT